MEKLAVRGASSVERAAYQFGLVSWLSCSYAVINLLQGRVVLRPSGPGFRVPILHTNKVS